MFIPSKKLMKRLVSSNGGIYFEENRRGNIPIILIKAPAYAIKSIINGAKIKIILSADNIKNKMIGCIGVNIEDDPKKPLNLYRTLTHVDKKQMNLFKKIINNKNKNENDIIFFDELCRPVISGNHKITDINIKKTNQTVECISLAPDITKKMQRKIMDLYEVNLNRLFEVKDINFDFWEEIFLKLSLNDANNIIHIDTGKYLIDQKDEGGGLEQTAHQMLKFLYGKDCYRSPQVGEGNKQRELTDILAYKDSHLCIVESKALSIIKNKKPKSTFRRVSNIKKDIKKGLKQIQGAVRKIRNGNKVFSTNDKLIKLKEDYVEIHGCILISEMHPDLDWDWVAKEIFRVAKKKHIVVQVFDVNEFFKALTISQDVNYFRGNLYIRWEEAIKNKNAFIRSR